MKLTAIILCLFCIFGAAFATLPCEKVQSKGSFLSNIFQRVANIFTSSSNFWVFYKSDAFTKLNSLVSLKNEIFRSIDSTYSKLTKAAISGKIINFREYKDLYDKKITNDLAIFQKNIDKTVAYFKDTTKLLRQRIDTDVLYTHKNLSIIIKSNWNNLVARDEIFKKFAVGCDGYSLNLPSSKVPLFYIGAVEVELYSVASIVNDNYSKILKCIDIDFLNPALKNDAQTCFTTTLKEFPASAGIASTHVNLASAVLERSLWYLNAMPTNLNNARFELMKAVKLIRGETKKK